MTTSSKSFEATMARDVDSINNGLPTYEESNTMAVAGILRPPNVQDTAHRRFEMLQQQDDHHRLRLSEFVSQYIVPYLGQRLVETNEFELVMIPAEEAEWRRFSKQVVMEDGEYFRILMGCFQTALETTPEADLLHSWNEAMLMFIDIEEESVPTVSLLSAPSDTVFSRVFMTGPIGTPTFWKQSGALGMLRREIVAGFLNSKDPDAPISGSSFRRHMAELQASLPERPREVKKRWWGQRGSSPGPSPREPDQPSSSETVDGGRGLRIRKEEVSLRWMSEFGLYETHVCEAIVVEAVLSEMIENSPWLRV
jgi:hypothetical protein